jgi:hypothetical protein
LATIIFAMLKTRDFIGFRESTVQLQYLFSRAKLETSAADTRLTVNRRAIGPRRSHSSPADALLIVGPTLHQVHRSNAPAPARNVATGASGRWPSALAMKVRREKNSEESDCDARRLSAIENLLNFARHQAEQANRVLASNNIVNIFQNYCEGNVCIVGELPSSIGGQKYDLLLIGSQLGG